MTSIDQYLREQKEGRKALMHFLLWLLSLAAIGSSLWLFVPVIPTEITLGVGFVGLLAWAIWGYWNVYWLQEKS